jgi:hypothetical protein
MRDTCAYMHQENSSTGVPRHLWHSCDSCWNRAKIAVPGADRVAEEPHEPAGAQPLAIDAKGLPQGWQKNEA